MFRLWLDTSINIQLAVAIIRRTTEDQVYDWSADAWVALAGGPAKSQVRLASSFGEGSLCVGSYWIDVPDGARHPGSAVVVFTSDLSGELWSRVGTYGFDDMMPSVRLTIGR